MEIHHDADLSGRNSFGMKVRAFALAEYSSVSELDELSRREDLPRPFFHIGRGSNLLFTGDFPGTVLHGSIRFIEPSAGDRCLVRAGAGVVWDEFCIWCAENGLWGSENLSMIPGECGAAAVQNIGAYGREVSELIECVECYDMSEHRLRTFLKEECRYSYRDSFFKNEGKGRFIVTSVAFRLKDSFSPCLEYGGLRQHILGKWGDVREGFLSPGMVRESVMEIRGAKLPDPAKTGSAGSFFRNPSVGAALYESIAAREDVPVPHYVNGDGSIKIPAAWLIDRCGWKGRREGNAGVWEKQPLVIVNANGEAAPGEIIRLEEKIRASVMERFGIMLCPEVEHV